MGLAAVKPRSYLPIGAYGLVGDGRTAALVGTDGSVDWLCWPRFDAPSVFGALLDAQRGGRFSIAPAVPFQSSQSYEPDTNILVTSFNTPNSTVELTDFMHVGDGAPDRPVLYRVVRCRHGEVELAGLVDPRPDYGAVRPTLAQTGNALAFDVPGGRLAVSSEPTVRMEGGTFSSHLSAGEVVAFRLGEAAEAVEWEGALAETRRFWEHWAAQCSYAGPWREAVLRSALALKLMIHAPTGAVVAAPTTSLPEEVGGTRNWDYRYTWLRDGALTLNALFALGYAEEADAYTDWVLRTLRGCACSPGLQPMYGIDGSCAMPERELDYLEGYRGSKPVRIGNAAHTQRQLDTYGELFDCLVVCRTFGATREPEVWPRLAGLADEIADHWREPDSGIWEVRDRPRHFVHSKVMAWVALDRAVHVAEALRLPADVVGWRRERELIRSDVLRHGLAGTPPVFIRAYDDPSPDASHLLLVNTGFLPADDPVMVATVERVRQELGSNGLVFRYRAEDGLPGSEGAFLPASFWLAEALVRTGRPDDGAAVFEEVLARTGPLGLLAEEVDPATGEYLGNYPQALSHIALINAALALAAPEAYTMRRNGDG